jgi:3-hydroxyacyl-[acyl-carrier-protein] dehydratase
MMDPGEESYIYDRIPHRPPFLWVDRVLEITPDAIRAEKTIPENLDLFRGHYPGYPLMPGVLLCEAVFQAGAVLLAQREETGARGMPVLTRIVGARFKREVRPGSRIVIAVKLIERIGPVWFLKGSVRVRDKLAVQVEFACAMKDEQGKGAG